MPDRMSAPQSGDEESAQAARERRSAREVAEWEAALRASKAAAVTPSTAGADSANAGALVSRAHRAEKTSGHSTTDKGDDTW
jgi:hypothetical protein